MAPKVSSVIFETNTPKLENPKASREPKEYLSSSWIPFSTQILSDFEMALNQSPEQARHIIKQDYAAYANLLKYSGDITDESSTSFDIYDHSHLVSFLENLKTKEPVHKLEKSSNLALSTLKYSVISATTAEMVASAVDLDQDYAFICSMTRQVGLLLVAWNYPRIFAKAQMNVSELGGNLSQEIEKILGLSPSKLAADICLQWPGAEEAKASVTSADSQKIKNSGFALKLSEVEDNSKASRLNYCLDLGDAMARLSNPDSYPQHSKQWQSATEELKTCIGPDALSMIQNKLSDLSGSYSSPEFTFPISLEPRKNLSHTAVFRVVDRLIAGNEWITKCHKLHQERFKNIYSLVDKRGISTDALNELILNLMPDLGFNKGCVYRFEENRMVLIPLLRLGSSDLKDFKVLSCSDAKVLKHPAIMATAYTTPVIQDNVLVNNEWVSAIAAVFGKSTRKAVLYVELSEEMAASIDRREAVVHFKAIQKTLADCFNLD
jgi:hypothetical protein